jgi:hypothetical protein
LIPDKNNRELIPRTTKLFFKFRQSLIMVRTAYIESFNFEAGKHCLQCGEVALKDDLAGLAILGMEEIDLDRGGGLSIPVNGEKK